MGILDLDILRVEQKLNIIMEELRRVQYERDELRQRVNELEHHLSFVNGYHSHSMSTPHFRQEYDDPNAKPPPKPKEINKDLEKKLRELL